jgi:hypothetical protein
MSDTTPITPKRTRAEIARANGAKSKGPVTLEGKAISSRNAIRHGLTAKEIVLPDESESSFRALRRSFFEQFNPRNVVERELVTALAATRWRLRRLVSIETGYLAHELDCEGGKFRRSGRPDSHKDIVRIFSRTTGRNGLPLRYESSLQRMYQRIYKQLVDLRGQPTQNFENRTENLIGLIEVSPESTDTSASHPPNFRLC